MYSAHRAPLVLAPYALENDHFDRQIERLELLGREDVLEESEIALLPEKELINGLFGLHLQNVLQFFAGHAPDDHQQFAEQRAVLLLHVEELLQLLLAQRSPSRPGSSRGTPSGFRMTTAATRPLRK